MSDRKRKTHIKPGCVQHDCPECKATSARIRDLETKLEAAERKANTRHETIAKAVFDTVQDHAATWDTASDEMMWCDPKVDCANEKHWKVSDEWLATCCVRFPQWADDLRAFAKSWNEDEPVTEEMLDAVEVDEKSIEQHTRRAMQIMRYYDKLRATERRAEAAERSRDQAVRELLEECEQEAAHIEQNGINLRVKFGDEHEGRCRELCAMYLREFVLAYSLKKKLAALTEPSQPTPPRKQD